MAREDTPIEGPKEPYQDYWSALGRFIHEFADVEDALRRLAFHVSGIDENVGKAILHGLRIDNAKSTVERVLTARGDQSTLKRLKPTLEQLSAISAMRNHLVHWAVESTETQGLQVTNRRVAHTDANVQSYFVSVELLDAMREDLNAIRELLWGEMIADLIGDPAPPSSWRYRPPPQHPKSRT